MTRRRTPDRSVSSAMTGESARLMGATHGAARQRPRHRRQPARVRPAARPDRVATDDRVLRRRASAVLYPLWPELVQLLIGEVVKGGLASDADRATWERLRSICAHSRERRSKPAGRGQAGSHRQPLLFLHTIASPFAARPVAPWSELRQYSPGR